jgi:uncharacterized protein involved in exopolysaccharide biosynthesis
MLGHLRVLRLQKRTNDIHLHIVRTEDALAKERVRLTNAIDTLNERKATVAELQRDLAVLRASAGAR